MAEENPKPVPALKIRSVSPSGFCRAGRRWVPEPQTVPLSDFTKKQVEALRAEPMLVVENTEFIPEPETEA